MQRLSAVNLAFADWHLAGACCDLTINLDRSCVSLGGGAQVDEVIANSLILG